MTSLLIQQLYREIPVVADENGGTLPNRTMFYVDKFGTLSPIQSAEMLYSASGNTVKWAVKDLEKAGLIRKESHYRENGSAIPNRYYLL